MAAATGAPPLSKGEDFAKTDLPACLWTAVSRLDGDAGFCLAAGVRSAEREARCRAPAGVEAPRRRL